MSEKETITQEDRPIRSRLQLPPGVEENDVLLGKYGINEPGSRDEKEASAFAVMKCKKETQKELVFDLVKQIAEAFHIDHKRLQEDDGVIGHVLKAISKPFGDWFNSLENKKPMTIGQFKEKFADKPRDVLNAFLQEEGQDVPTFIKKLEISFVEKFGSTYHITPPASFTQISNQVHRTEGAAMATLPPTGTTNSNGNSLAA